MKRKPVHNKTSKPIPSGRISRADANLTWRQVKKKYPGLHPFADTDCDGKRNYEDCRPLDETRHGLWGSTKVKKAYPEDAVFDWINEVSDQEGETPEDKRAIQRDLIKATLTKEDLERFESDSFEED